MEKIHYKNFDRLEKEYVQKGLIRKSYHPIFDFAIYNYGIKVQFEALWDEITLEVRGLILDSKGNIIARPFDKFFNYEELVSGDENKRLKIRIPNERVKRITEKIDGSLGILYKGLDGKHYIATRGSFNSDQAIKANEILNKKYNNEDFMDGYTYLFEIIYPENRIIINYGETEDLILLAVRNNKTGEYLDLYENFDSSNFNLVVSIETTDYCNLTKENKINNEGYVIEFESGFRMKMKFEEYVRLHKFVSGFSNISIWEVLASGGNIYDLIENIPDELYNWINKQIKHFKFEFDKLCNFYFEVFKNTKEKITNLYGKELNTIFSDKDIRKIYADFFIRSVKNPNILFMMLDKKDWKKAIWKQLKPQDKEIFRKEFIK